MFVSACSILAVESREDAGIFLVLTTTGHYSLFPLIFTPAGKQEVQRGFYSEGRLLQISSVLTPRPVAPPVLTHVTD